MSQLAPDNSPERDPDRSSQRQVLVRQELSPRSVTLAEPNPYAVERVLARDGIVLPAAVVKELLTAVDHRRFVEEDRIADILRSNCGNFESFTVARAMVLSGSGRAVPAVELSYSIRGAVDASDDEVIDATQADQRVYHFKWDETLGRAAFEVSWELPDLGALRGAARWPIAIGALGEFGVVTPIDLTRFAVQRVAPPGIRHFALTPNAIIEAEQPPLECHTVHGLETSGRASSGGSAMQAGEPVPGDRLYFATLALPVASELLRLCGCKVNQALMQRLLSHPGPRLVLSSEIFSKPFGPLDYREEMTYSSNDSVSRSALCWSCESSLYGNIGSTVIEMTAVGTSSRIGKLLEYGPEVTFFALPGGWQDRSLPWRRILKLVEPHLCGWG